MQEISVLSLRTIRASLRSAYKDYFYPNSVLNKSPKISFRLRTTVKEFSVISLMSKSSSTIISKPFIHHILMNAKVMNNPPTLMMANTGSTLTSSTAPKNLIESFRSLTLTQNRIGLRPLDTAGTSRSMK